MKIRRVIVDLDPVPQSRAVIEAAVALAGHWEVELVGLFVENIDLLHFAGLPFAAEVGTALASRRALNVASMERLLRARARAAEQTLASIAGRAAVRWTFRVARGSAAVELLAAAADADLVIANVELVEAREVPVRVRVIRAEDADALRAALEAEPEGIVVLAGKDAARVGRTLWRLAAR